MGDLIVFLILLSLGYVFGRYIEAKHYRSIIKREALLRHIPAITTKIIPQGEPLFDGQLVSGSVVISIDYFKQVIAGLRNLTGGRITSYETLLDRARREAILRMKQQAKACNANLIFNVKLETSSISKGAKGKIGSVEVLAYGTAFKSIKKEN